MGKKGLISGLVLLITLAATGVALARPEYVPLIPKTYEVKGCTTCHSANWPERNEVGKKFEANGLKFVENSPKTEAAKPSQPVKSAPAAPATPVIANTTRHTTVNVQTTVDGKTANLKGIVISGRSYVPVRDLFAGLGGTVAWNQADKVVTLHYDSYQLQLFTRDRTMTLNDAPLVDKRTGQPYQFDFMFIDGKVYASVRNVMGKAFGFDIKYDPINGVEAQKSFGILSYLRNLFK